jgi:hypothetical protein
MKVHLLLVMPSIQLPMWLPAARGDDVADDGSAPNMMLVAPTS